MKLSNFKCLIIKEAERCEVFEILSRLILEHVKVTWEGKVGNYTQFVSSKMTFWLALPSWLLKVPIILTI